jgi:hypothetical protein
MALPFLLHRSGAPECSTAESAAICKQQNVVGSCRACYFCSRGFVLRRIVRRAPFFSNDVKQPSSSDGLTPRRRAETLIPSVGTTILLRVTGVKGRFHFDVYITMRYITFPFIINITELYGASPAGRNCQDRQKRLMTV